MKQQCTANALLFTYYFMKHLLFLLSILIHKSTDSR